MLFICGTANVNSPFEMDVLIGGRDSRLVHDAQKVDRNLRLNTEA